jgi:D-alanyl-D-alanine carboxypeptidase/D-alanyl-D-alanine-endopeptidase (penicillin-binding protein 4)
VAARFAALGALLALCATSASPAAAQRSLAALQGELGRELSAAGAASSASVYDISAQRAVFSRRAGSMRPPASVEKLFTASAALERLGPGARLSTTVLGSGQLGPEGVWEGNLYLRGGGDPTFGSSRFVQSHYGGAGASVSALVSQLVRAAGVHAVTGQVIGDESYLDALRGGPASGYGYDPFLEGTLSGLAFDRGAVGSERGAHAPAAYAARKLWASLKSAGVSVEGGIGVGRTPAGATSLAVVQSPTIAQLLGLMLPPSDNYFAETLIKDLGALSAGAGTTSAGAAAVSATMTDRFTIHPRIVDGSGLSRADATSTSQVVTLLAALAARPGGAILRGDLALAGRSGTLMHRMLGSAAAGRCQAKTGTLIGVSNLAGYCQSLSGHLLAFAIFNDGIATEAAHAVQDRMAASMAGS